MKIKFARAFMRPNECSHGPQEWPWWRLVGFSVVSLGVTPPSSGKRLWVYTRWWAAHADIYFDRRERQPVCPVCGGRDAIAGTGNCAVCFNHMLKAPAEGGVK